jgi:UDP-glucose 4-epimerase
MKNKILITGGAGYIGSHTNLELANSGYETIVLDNLINGHRDLALTGDFTLGDVGDAALLELLFSKYNIEAVMHFAAFAYVGESIKRPHAYYYNNVTNTITLLEAMRHAGVRKFIFSSTCATYGLPKHLPISEEHPQEPINPYGRSKLMIEKILEDYTRAYGFKSLFLRYFNAAGADPDGRVGERHNPETHLIPLAIEAAISQNRELKVFGQDYDTSDGTCIRDYIHVSDLAQAHRLGLEHLLDNGPGGMFNLGNGSGFSVKQVLDCVSQVTCREVKWSGVERRPGDPPELVGSCSKISSELGWKPNYADLKDIIRTAYAWRISARF